MASKGESSGSNTPTKIKEPVIGIDLGTTYSCVVVWHRNKVEIILNDINQRLTPSCVAFTDDEILVGEGAMNQITSNPQNTIFDVKRLIGRRFDDAVVKKDVKLWPFKVVEGSKGEPKIWVEYQGEGKTHTVQEISSMVLRKMKDSAEAFLNCEVKNAVITVPAYFNDSQRRATRDAGQIAGLNVVRVINEPTAAALAYAHSEQHISKQLKNVLIFDLGGGTLDVSIVEMEGSQFNVKSTAGDTHLGGEDFDNCMVEYMAGEFKRKNNNDDITKKPKPLRRLRKEWEKAKRQLSNANQVWINVDGLYGEIDFRMKITRAKFEELNKSLFLKCLDSISECLNGAGMTKRDIDEVVLVGGSSRIPKIRQLVKEYFDGKEACQSVNPDEAVAIGAAIQGAILCKVQHEDIIDLRVFDVTPLSLGINNGGKMSFVVNRSTPIPVEIPITRYTAFDNQTQMVFQVFEGERSFVKDNHLLGDFTLDGITRAPAARQAVVELIFKIDEDGILTVTAKDKQSGKEKSLKIENYSGRLETEEINRMIEDGEKWRAHDDKLKGQAYAKNELDTCLNNMIRKLNDVSLKVRIGQVTYNNLKTRVSDLKKWTEMEGNSASCQVLKNKNLELKKMEKMLK